MTMRPEITERKEWVRECRAALAPIVPLVILLAVPLVMCFAQRAEPEHPRVSFQNFRYQPEYIALRDAAVAESLGHVTHAQLTAYGTPTADYRQVGSYLMSYDGRTRSARWTLECLTASSLSSTVKRDTESFKIDREVGEEFRASSGDYARSGFDIGHLAPAANHTRDQDSLDATFSFSNATPQRPEFNRGPWRRLEEHVRDLAATSPVWVITCPLWIPVEGRLSFDVIGPNRVWVPTHCGKAVLIETADGPELRAWIMPNGECPGELDDYRVSVDEFEAAAGIDLWAELDDPLEKRLEAHKWN